ncbi:protein involved in plasmid replication-relaxation [Streptomyces sp. TLI_55]|uniref:replication-relaxation family protein n=1 Tax=Streptomyces sp. TLI_55 TaxID=1938861 RepID=UPI000BCE9EEA|nr:replication-relaxation family protein [Streptomyces sp. TLI_55]SNX88532.1 protein involved in plasmid replication-relaxation [Streptomyces sp. TLI_55]
MLDVDAGSGDRLALAVLAQYRMATTEQMHVLIAPDVRIEQTRRRLVKLSKEGLVDRITLPRAGRTRVWFLTDYGAEIASEWPELREWKSAKLGADRTAARLKAAHTLTVTQTGLAFVQDARRRGGVCRPLDWIPEAYQPLGGGEGVIPDALLYYRIDRDRNEDWPMLRAFVEVDRATMGPERLAAKIHTYQRLFEYVPVSVGRSRAGQEPPEEGWQRRYRVFPRLLFVLDGTGPAGVENRVSALAAGAAVARPAFRAEVPMLAASLTDILRDGPSAPVWRPLNAPEQRVSWHVK